MSDRNKTQTARKHQELYNDYLKMLSDCGGKSEAPFINKQRIYYALAQKYYYCEECVRKIINEQIKKG
jgi:hypothetical protein